MGHNCSLNKKLAWQGPQIYPGPVFESDIMQMTMVPILLSLIFGYKTQVISPPGWAKEVLKKILDFLLMGESGTQLIRNKKDFILSVLQVKKMGHNGKHRTQ